MYILTIFTPMSYFYTPGKLKKTFDFLIFSRGGVEIGH